MIVKTSFTNRVWRWGTALVATFVTSLVGLYPEHVAFGEEAGCSLRDVQAWQDQLTDPTEELSPPYILETTEAFLSQCPNRPEVAEASRIAGVSAVDNGEAKRALAHFDRAGWISDRASLFAQAAAFLANREDEMGWIIRDEIIEAWLGELSRTPLITVDEIEAPGGVVYAVNFTRTDADSGLRAAWVAVPEAAGWPATLTIGSERRLNAFHRLRAGEEAATQSHIQLHRCRGRKLLAETEIDLSSLEFEQTAKLALTAYLANPDLYQHDPEGEIHQCYATHRLLPGLRR
ncbi:MAG: hypothetical protein QNI84_01200 [Henriciella sp.]|nr:hypothetical protein [Henriciella sp.]